MTKIMVQKNLEFKEKINNFFKNLTNKEKFNYLFEYRDYDLFIKNKWAISSQVGKRVKNAVFIDNIRFKKEDIIWIMNNGYIKKGYCIKKIKKEKDFNINNLQCVEYQHMNGRPLGVKDKEKRSVKSFLTSKQERYIKDNWFNYPTKHFVENLNITSGMVMGARRTLNLPTRLQSSTLATKCKNIKSLKGKVGIYIIVTSDKKSYIGSSTNIFKRIQSHLNKLNNNKHQNKSLQSSWDKNGYYGVIEECDEQNLIERENYYIKYTTNLHNVCSYKEITQDQINYFKPKILEKIDIKDSGCWEYIGSIDKAGYGQVSTRKYKKKIPVHRIMYFANNNDVNQKNVVRHLCNNKKCCNPDHLESGSYRDNILDIKREEMNLFEKRFVETECGFITLANEFSMNKKQVMNRIYHLDLFVKYPHLKKRWARQLSVRKNV